MIVKTPKELGALIKEILDCCFKDNALPNELSERLFPSSDHFNNNSLPMYLSTLYNKARYKALGFREENLRLPSLPKEQKIGFKGLESIQEWCIDAQNPTETEQNTTPAKPDKESWPWKLYEKTLKVIVNAVMERLLPK